MERNLESIIEEIAQNEELSKEFMAMDEIDEIYAYCKEMGLNSSEEEFDEEVSSMIDNFDSNYSKIGDFELENVAGGSMLDKNFNKVVASALSALTIAGAGAANSNFASAASDASASTVSVSASEKTQSAKNIKSSSKMEYTKEKFNEIKNSLLRFCKKHKIAVGVTTAAIILVAIYGSVALYKKDANPLHWFNKAKTTKDDDNQNNQTGGSTSAGSNMTKEDAVRAVVKWGTNGDLSNVPVDAIKLINDHKDEDPALEELSRKVSERMQQLEAVNAVSTWLRSGDLTNIPQKAWKFIGDNDTLRKEYKELLTKAKAKQVELEQERDSLPPYSGDSPDRHVGEEVVQDEDDDDMDFDDIWDNL